MRPDHPLAVVAEVPPEIEEAGRAFLAEMRRAASAPGVVPADARLRALLGTRSGTFPVDGDLILHHRDGGEMLLGVAPGSCPFPRSRTPAPAPAPEETLMSDDGSDGWHLSIDLGAEPRAAAEEAVGRAPDREYFDVEGGTLLGLKWHFERREDRDAALNRWIEHLQTTTPEETPP